MNKGFTISLMLDNDETANGDYCDATILVNLSEPIDRTQMVNFANQLAEVIATTTKTTLKTNTVTISDAN